ncbi:uncharacterized protein [Chelonus insularis]|uniref:uncharacterized protein n=1 Tax=Chelonus insularis TaxID=460826 RepID=UPI00158E78DD|nr:uncharacterized protein LOC118074102 [Chelonus insularis]XP_034950908.1 uncharacterized protein LOC118074102 [Chelonus insularis]XP_034950909.1 uncharacterized protein LOC118074102 [Chelonus insularis]
MVKPRKLLREGEGPMKMTRFAIITRRARRCAREKRLRAKVLRMLSQKRAEADAEGGGGGGDGAVTPGSISNGETTKEFLLTGRTGRRNAMPDILSQHAETGTANLPSRLDALSIDSQHDQPGTSEMDQAGPSTSQEQMG